MTLSDDISNAAVVQQRLDALSADHRFLTELLQQAPGFIAVLRGPEHVFETANDRYICPMGKALNTTGTITFYTGTACMEFIEVTAQGQYPFFFNKLMVSFSIL